MQGGTEGSGSKLLQRCALSLALRASLQPRKLLDRFLIAVPQPCTAARAAGLRLLLLYQLTASRCKSLNARGEVKQNMREMLSQAVTKHARSVWRRADVAQQLV